MPTITQYKSHYPNLTHQQLKLMHAARIATEYSTWTSSLTHTRTVALAPLIFQVEPDIEQKTIAASLLASISAMNYGADVLHYPRLNADHRLLTQTAVPNVCLEGIKLERPDWTVCKKIGYHSDDVDCDATAYAFWCVKSTAPMTLMLGGNAYPMPDGQLVIFDARVPHALLSANPDASMAAVISLAPLTPQLREHLGIAWRRASSTSLEKLQLMDRLDVNADTGDFTFSERGLPM